MSLQSLPGITKQDDSAPYESFSCRKEHRLLSLSGTNQQKVSFSWQLDPSPWRTWQSGPQVVSL